MTCNNNFYLTILDRLRFKTNLQKVREELNISKQQMNYYLRQLKKRGLIQNKGYGWWELTNQSKRMTKYDNFLKKDMIRGHAYVWEVKLINKPENWDKRLEILKKKKINHKIVGAKNTTPRIKALGRKVWLCKDHLRIFDIEKSSYYGENAIEARKNSFLQLLRIVQVLENKLGFSLKPFNWEFRKEHYALIKNDFAIEQNNKGIIIRINDEYGEWLLVDDSLGMGGELENIGKKSFETNIPMKKWWNDNKKHNFKVTPEFILKGFNNLIQIQEKGIKHQAEYSRDLVEHKGAIKRMSYSTEANSKTIELLAGVVKELSEEVRKLK